MEEKGVFYFERKYNMAYHDGLHGHDLNVHLHRHDVHGHVHDHDGVMSGRGHVQSRGHLPE